MGAGRPPFTPLRRSNPLFRLLILPVMWVALASGIALILPHQRPGVPSTLFLIAVLASAFMAGFWSGMVTSVVAIVVLDLLFLTPKGSFHLVSVDDGTLLSVFFVAAALAAWALQRLQRARTVAELARGRAAALAALTADLADTLGVDEVGDVLVEHMTAGLGAMAAGVFVLEPGGDRLAALATSGYPGDMMRRWATFPLEADVPAAEAVRDRRVILLGSLRERAARYVAVSRENPTMGGGALAAVPLLSAGRAVGSVTLSFADRHRFTADDDRFLQVLGLQGANALERARLRVEERLAQERTAFLAEASRALAASLDFEATLEELARLTVPRLADWATVDLAGDGDRIHLVAAAHRDPELARYVREDRERLMPENAEVPGPADVIRSGRPAFHPVVSLAPPDEAASAGSGGPLGRLRVRSLVIVPMSGGDATLGAITLAYSESERQYRPEDLEVAEDLAARAAAAIQNARLFRAQAQARAALEVAEARLRVLSAASRALASSLDLPHTLRRVVRLAVQHLADAAAVYLTDEADDLRPLAVAPAGAGPYGTPGRGDASKEIDRSREREHVRAAFATGRPQVDPGHVAGTSPEGGDLGAPAAGTSMALPLVLGDRSVGVLSLWWRSPRAIPPDELLLAEEMARRMARAIENARLYEDRDRAARALQQDLLPRSFPDIPRVEVAARYRPSSLGNLVGGDFYDLFEAGPGRWIAAIGDVCGKGPEAAAVMGIARFTLRALALHETRPAELLSVLNGSMLGHGLQDRFVTIGCALLEPAGDAFRVRLCLAGHPRPVLARPGGDVELLGEHGMPVGLVTDPVLHETEHRLDPGDTLVLYTDGLDAADMPAEDRVARLLRDAEARASDLKVIVETLVEAAAEHGRRLQDDVAVLALKLTD